MKPEAVSESETEWNRRAKSRKPNQDTTRWRGLFPAPKGPAGALKHTAGPGSEHNRAALAVSENEREAGLNPGELNCAEAEKLFRRAGKPPPISGHVPWRAAEHGTRARGKLDFTGRPVSTAGAG